MNDDESSSSDGEVSPLKDEDLFGKPADLFAAHNPGFRRSQGLTLLTDHPKDASNFSLTPPKTFSSTSPRSRSPPSAGALKKSMSSNDLSVQARARMFENLGVAGNSSGNSRVQGGLGERRKSSILLNRHVHSPAQTVTVENVKPVDGERHHHPFIRHCIYRFSSTTICCLLYLLFSVCR
jgi:hypothetical protein